MMSVKELSIEMGRRPLKTGEILQGAYRLMNEKFGWFLILSVLVYLPINLVQQFPLLQIDLTGLAALSQSSDVSMEELIQSDQMQAVIKQAGIQAGISVVMLFVERIAIMVTAVILHYQLFIETATDQAGVPYHNQESFGQVFYQGIRMWPRGAATLFFLLLGFLIAVLCLGVLSLSPVMLFVTMPVMIFCMLRFLMYESSSGAVAALRGRIGFDNLNYVRTVLGDRSMYLFGQYTVAILISNGLSMVFNVLMTMSLQYITNQWAAYAASCAIGTLLSILNLYGFTAQVLIFLSREEYLRAQAQQAGTSGQQDPGQRQDKW